MSARPRFGWWTFRFGVSFVVLGFGVSVGVLNRAQRGLGNGGAWPRSPRWPVCFFRNYAYRGLRAPRSGASNSRSESGSVEGETDA